MLIWGEFFAASLTKSFTSYSPLFPLGYTLLKMFKCRIYTSNTFNSYFSVLTFYSVQKIRSTTKTEKAFTKTENYVITQDWMCICLESIITFKLFAVLLNATFKFGIVPCYNLLIAIPSRSKGEKKD